MEQERTEEVWNECVAVVVAFQQARAHIIVAQQSVQVSLESDLLEKASLNYRKSREIQQSTAGFPLWMYVIIMGMRPSESTFYHVGKGASKASRTHQVEECNDWKVHQVDVTLR